MRSLLASALLLGCLPLLAQSSSSPVIAVAQPPSQNCPVALSARHSPQGAVERVHAAPPHSAPEYTLTFAPRDAASITHARITLHGIAGAHVMPAGSGSLNATEDLNLAPHPRAGHHFESVLYAHKLTGVQWIELDELTFADGAHWQKSASSRCIVAPSGLLLINAQPHP